MHKTILALYLCACGGLTAPEPLDASLVTSAPFASPEAASVAPSASVEASTGGQYPGPRDPGASGRGGTSTR